MPLLSRDSPCIGHCSTVYGDDICRGCHRYFEEVLHWETLTRSQRDGIMARVLAILQRAVSEFLNVVDADLLAAQLERHQVMIPELDCAQSRVLVLLEAGAVHMRDFAAYGLQATPAAGERSAPELYSAIAARRLELAQTMFNDRPMPPCQVRAFG